ncbi:MAG: radical SAM protein [Magnetococcales bacterium]|nr:radical SAM protein [Magnetococcales bacterium]
MGSMLDSKRISGDTRKRSELLTRIGARPVAIWGARMTGLGFYRLALREGIHPVAFLDSDPALQLRRVKGLPVYAPSRIPELRTHHPDLLIIVAVALKEDEILRLLADYGVSRDDFVNFNDYLEHYYTIDVVGTCNLRCQSCAYDMGYRQVKGMISMEDFSRVVAKMAQEVEIVSHVSLYNWGEPFLHPHLDQIITHLHEYGIAVAVSTNLSYIQPQRIRDVVKAAPDYLKISLSGYDPAVYDTTHQGGNLHLVKSNLHLLKYHLEQSGADTLVDVNYHLYKNNCGKNLEKMTRLCDELGFMLSTTYALVMPVERVIDHCEGHPDAKTQALSKLLLVDIDEGRETTRAFRDLPCRYLTNQVNINWDRSVALCCVCFERPQADVAADYLEVSLDEIRRAKAAHPLCERCIHFGLPAYNLGFNQAEWRRIAQSKEIDDV